MYQNRPTIQFIWLRMNSPKEIIEKMTTQALGVIARLQTPKSMPRIIGPVPIVKPLQIPKVTATDFPPRKFNHGENVWPRSGASAIRAISQPSILAQK